MSPIDVVSDSNVVLKWFHAEGEEDVEGARGLLERYRQRRIGLYILDLTMYEVGNALLRGRRVSAHSVAKVLDSLGEMVPRWVPKPDEWARASDMAAAHNLTLYDAAYAAVAEQRDARLATVDARLLSAGLGTRPSALLADL